MPWFVRDARHYFIIKSNACNDSFGEGMTVQQGVMMGVRKY